MGRVQKADDVFNLPGTSLVVYVRRDDAKCMSMMRKQMSISQRVPVTRYEVKGREECIAMEHE